MQQNIKNCTHYLFCNGEADDRFVSTFLMWRNFSMWQIFSTFQRDNFRVQTEISPHCRIFLHGPGLSARDKYEVWPTGLRESSVGHKLHEKVIHSHQQWLWSFWCGHSMDNVHFHHAICTSKGRCWSPCLIKLPITRWYWLPKCLSVPKVSQGSQSVSLHCVKC